MKTTNKEISNVEVIEQLNCPTCKCVIEAIKQKRYYNLYCAYDSVANDYGITFGIDITNKDSYIYIKYDDVTIYENEYKTTIEAQKEIIHQSMYELAHRIESGYKKTIIKTRS